VGLLQTTLTCSSAPERLIPTVLHMALYFIFTYSAFLAQIVAFSDASSDDSVP
jgi:hypothetical protein